MAKYDALAEQMKARFAELAGRTGQIEDELREPLEPRFSEQATQLEDEDPLEGIDDVLLAEMQQIEAALHRITDNAYGTCVDCGDEIAMARLEAMPTAIRCINCATTAAEGN